MRVNLKRSILSCPNLSDSSSHPVVLVECGIVGEPYASLPVQLAWNARTSAAAILMVLEFDDLPAKGCPTHVEQSLRKAGGSERR